MKKIFLFLGLILTVSFTNAANWPFSSAIKVDNTLYMSGQLGIIPPGEKVVPGGIAAETRQAMENIKHVLKDNGLTVNNIIKCTVMLSDINEWSKMNEVYISYFPNKKYPTRSAYGVSGLALNGRVEIECLAAKNHRLITSV